MPCRTDGALSFSKKGAIEDTQITDIPALSAHLRKKEKELGVKLFDRRKQPLELTEAGKAYLEYAEKAASLEDEMHRDKQFAALILKRGRIDIGLIRIQGGSPGIDSLSFKGIMTMTAEIQLG